MKGLELSRKYYEEFGKNLIDTEFPEIKNKLAFGLVGDGSECFGFDDEISTDHDFEPGFCIFVPEDLDRKELFTLERAYAKLPKEFMGYKRSVISPVGGNRKGVISISDFYKSKIGHSSVITNEIDWFGIPDSYLAVATNGEVFEDNLGLFTEIRKSLLNMPENIRLKKLAGNLLIMAQSGQYNYKRCISHGETAAAQLAVFEFVKATLSVIFLLNKAYMPFYKWQFRALSALPDNLGISDTLEMLITTDNTSDIASVKAEVIEDIASIIIDRLQKQGITKAICGDLEKHAYSVNDAITNSEIRNLNILYAIT